ncbi:hypothetical protein [Paraburkholderia sp. RAU2J]|uniref:hypothetical protein n=1 Tax=Paraburkholderia sp. RAU2J TaxID=1938810 RepID=UPI00267F08A7
MKATTCAPSSVSKPQSADAGRASGLLERDGLSFVLSLGLKGWLGAYERSEIDAGHWVILREPARIAACIEGFVSRDRTEHVGPVAAPLNARAAGA